MKIMQYGRGYFFNVVNGGMEQEFALGGKEAAYWFDELKSKLTLIKFGTLDSRFYVNNEAVGPAPSIYVSANFPSHYNSNSVLH